MPTVAEAFAVALQHHQGGRLEQAEAIYQQILLTNPNHPEATHFLGLLAHQTGNDEIAEQLLRRSVTLNAYEPAFYHNLGDTLCSLGKTSEAIACFQRALELNPRFSESCYNLANTYRGLGRLEEAATLYCRATELQPRFAPAFNNLGLVRELQKRWTDAVACYRQAVEIAPQFMEAHNNLGNALHQLGQLHDAERCHRRAIELEPSNVDAYVNLGNDLNQLTRLDEAIACYHRAIELCPTLTEAHNNLGAALRQYGKLDESVAACQRALELKFDNPEAHNNLANSLKSLGRMSEARSHYKYAMDRSTRAEFQSNYLMCLVYDASLPEEEVLIEHADWGEKFGRPPSSWVQHQNSPVPHRRLRIGYLSGDFIHHPVTSFIEPILRHHDHQKFEVYCYSNNPHCDDATERLKRLADHWRFVAGLNDEELAQKIQEDRIDILVELSGHTARNRLLALSLKPAPIQVTYIGYPATTGLRAIDYRLTDETLNPSHEPANHVERLYRLPCGSACFTPRSDCPEVTELPATSNRFLTFGAPHNITKLNADVYNLWARILHALPDSRLVLFRETIQGAIAEELRSQFSRRGIRSERLDLLRVASATHSYSGYMAKYGDIDICLDTFPTNAGATCCESLWMGVPWLTQYGSRFFGRQTASVLVRLGLKDWIAPSPESVVEKAVYWSSHMEELSKIRKGLRQRFADSTLGNPHSYTYGLESAFRDMWTQWCHEKNEKNNS